MFESVEVVALLLLCHEEQQRLQRQREVRRILLGLRDQLPPSLVGHLKAQVPELDRFVPAQHRPHAVNQREIPTHLRCQFFFFHKLLTCLIGLSCGAKIQ